MHLFLRAVSICLIVIVSLAGGLQAQEKNSTRKIRIKPSEQSAKCGSAVNWRESVAAAVKESTETGKPVFWYVPTIDGSFMDRKPVIDQYMMAGPFSWPAIIETLNQHYIPVRATANSRQQEKYKLETYKFVEPGFVILRDAKNVRQIDQLTTLNPEWLNRLIAGIAEVDVKPLHPRKYAEDWKRFANGEYDFKPARERGLDTRQCLLNGMLLFRQGKMAEAQEAWKQGFELAKADDPLGWKCLAEAENWGPFVRGFEVHRALPESAYAAGIKSRGSAAPSGIYSEKEMWQRSVEFLIAMQNENGGWLDSDYDFGGTDSLPNVHVAVSALSGEALLEAKSRLPEQAKTISAAIEKAAEFCSNPENMNYVDRDEILWANAYRVRFFSKLVQSSEEAKVKYNSALANAVTDLESIQTKRGGWYHEYANPFVTATALTALKRAETAGAKISKDKVVAGANALSADRFDNGAYPYSSRRSRPTASRRGGSIPASAGRMPICELALWQWEQSDDERLQAALAASFKHHEFLEASYKYDNHTSTLAYGGFFFWYDMRSRAEALTFLKNAEAKKQFAGSHRKLVLELPELDGCFVDSHELGRCYGTAMALLTLSFLDECQK